MANQKKTNTNEGAGAMSDPNQQAPQSANASDIIKKSDPQKVQRLADPDDRHDLDEEEE